MLLSMFADGIIYQHVRPSTIGLVYWLPANIPQLTLRSAVRHIGNKLFLRELFLRGWLTIDRQFASYGLLKLSSYCACFSSKMFCSIILFFSSLLSLPLSFFLYFQSLFRFSTAICVRDYLKPLLFRRWSFKCIARFRNAPRMRGFVRTCRP